MLVTLILFLTVSSVCCSGNTSDDRYKSDATLKSSHHLLCPVWSVPGTNCSCGSEVSHRVMCDTESLNIHVGYCMYYDEELNGTFLGRCLQTTVGYSYATYYNIARSANGTKFNQDMCLHNQIAGNMHRQGRFCGECVEGYGLAAYSYYFIHCINCSNYGYKNWIGYFAKAYLPLTVFYFMVIVFRINANAPPLNTIILICQYVTLPSFMRIWTAFIENDRGGINKSALKVFGSIFSIWSSDFGSLFYSPICLHPSISIMHIMALDYLVAVYPLVLILLTYVLVELHDKDYRVLVWMWKPFQVCFSRVHRDWQLKSSLVDGFATFITLSYVRLCSVSFDLLFPTTMYDVYGDTVGKYYLYYDATVELFGKKHLPFAILAIVVIVFLVLLPLALLFLYPWQWFQKFLNFIPVRRNCLNILMDSFQGHYRFAPVDCRYFAGFLFLLRIFVILSYELTSVDFSSTIIGVLIVLTTALVVILQPYKERSSNTMDIIMWLLVLYALIGGQGHIIASSVAAQYIKVAQGIFSAAPVLLVLIIATLGVVRLFKAGTLLRRMLAWVFNIICTQGRLALLHLNNPRTNREENELPMPRNEMSPLLT